MAPLSPLSPLAPVSKVYVTLPISVSRAKGRQYPFKHRAPKRVTPEHLKDDKYLARRIRNNESSRVWRMNASYDQLLKNFKHATAVDKNITLKKDIKRLQRRLKKLKGSSI